MRFISRLVVACGLLVLSACSRGDSDEVARLKAELEAARAEAAAAKAALAQLKASTNSPPKGGGEDAEVLEFGKGFVADIEEKRLASAYRSMSAAYQQQVERKAFDDMVDKYGIRKLELVNHRQHKVRRLADGKAFEFYCTARELNAREPLGATALAFEFPGVGPRVNFALTVSPEAGAWKVNDLEITVEKQK